MQRYVSVRANAKYFTECVTKCLIDNKHREPTEKDFWDFISTIQFENDVISRNCKFFKTLLIVTPSQDRLIYGRSPLKMPTKIP